MKVGCESAAQTSSKMSSAAEWSLSDCQRLDGWMDAIVVGRYEEEGERKKWDEVKERKP